MGRLGKKDKGKWAGPKEIVNFSFDSNIFKMTRIDSIKSGFPDLENFQIKYGFEDFKIRNNFPYWNISKFKIEFELKIRKCSRVCNPI
jgi:hypothetical protein